MYSFLFDRQTNYFKSIQAWYPCYYYIIIIIIIIVLFLPSVSRIPRDLEKN